MLNIGGCKNENRSHHRHVAQMADGRYWESLLFMYDVPSYCYPKILMFPLSWMMEGRDIFLSGDHLCNPLAAISQELLISLLLEEDY